MRATELEILVDLVEEDLDRDVPLFELNVNHDAGGKFTSKEGAVAYQQGYMAAGRAAGIRAKKAGGSREEVRAAIKQGMESHHQYRGGGGKGKIMTFVRRKMAQGDLKAARKEKPEPKEKTVAMAHPILHRVVGG